MPAYFGRGALYISNYNRQRVWRQNAPLAVGGILMPGTIRASPLSHLLRYTNANLWLAPFGVGGKGAALRTWALAARLMSADPVL